MSPSFLTCLCMTDSTHREFSMKSLCVLASGLQWARVLLKDVNTDESFYITTLPFEKLNTRLCLPHHASVSKLTDLTFIGALNTFHSVLLSSVSAQARTFGSGGNDFAYIYHLLPSSVTQNCLIFWSLLFLFFLTSCLM